MIADLKPYSAMKDSGVEWLGQVPEHWEVLPNRALFSEVKDQNYPDEPMLSVTISRGVIRQTDLLSESSKKDSSNLDKSKYKFVQIGDIAYNKMRAWQGAIGESKNSGIISPAYIVQRPREAVFSSYIHYLFRIPSFAKEAERWSYGITSDMWSLRPEHFKLIYSCKPPLPEQTAIVRFLDHVDRRIRRYIRAKQKLIKLLEEQKQAIIHQAVTGQIDVRTGKPYPAYKPSGVEWLGEVPKHWEVKKLRFLFRYEKGRRAAELTNEYIGHHLGSFPVYSGQTESSGLMGMIDWYEFDFDGPVVFVTTVGARAMSTRLVTGRFSLSQNCALIIPRSTEANTAYFEPVLKRVFDYEKASISLIMQPSLRFGDLNRFYVPVPPLPEQSAIAHFLEEAFCSIALATETAQKEIALLREYRTRLIADVVTGKLDVREAAANLPEETESQDDALEEYDIENDGDDLDAESESEYD